MSEAVNIGPSERAKRRFMGLVGLTAAVGWGFACILHQAPWWGRLPVFLFAWMGALGLLQAREKTCIALAARGACNLDGREEIIRDPNVVRALKVQARRIHRRALWTAIASTVVVLILPDRLN